MIRFEAKYSLTHAGRAGSRTASVGLNEQHKCEGGFLYMINLRPVLATILFFSQSVVQTAYGQNLMDVYRKAAANDARYAGALGSYKAERENTPKVLPRCCQP